MIEFSKRNDALLGETIYHGVHESGANVYVMPKKGYQKCHAMFATRYGKLRERIFKGQRKNQNSGRYGALFGA